MPCIVVLDMICAALRTVRRKGMQAIESIKEVPGDGTALWCSRFALRRSSLMVSAMFDMSLGFLLDAFCDK